MQARDEEIEIEKNREVATKMMVIMKRDYTCRVGLSQK